LGLPVEKEESGDIMASLEKSTENKEAQPLATPFRVPATTTTLAELVTDALNNPKYEWRTVEGIAKEASLPMGDVSYTLERDLSDEVVRSSIPDERGRSLYMTRDRYNRRRTLVNRILSVLSDEIR
jgi:hypothetical protein